MFDSLEAFTGSTPDALRRAIRRDQSGILLLQFHQFPVEPVIDRILHRRCIEHVVGMGCLLQQLAEFDEAFCCHGR